MDLAEFSAVTRKMNRELFRSGARMDAMYFCPHHPDWDAGKKRSSPKNCGCRKPEPGLLEKACRAHGTLPSETVMIGEQPKILRHHGVSVVSVSESGPDTVDRMEPAAPSLIAGRMTWLQRWTG